MFARERCYHSSQAFQPVAQHGPIRAPTIPGRCRPQPGDRSHGCWPHPTGPGQGSVREPADPGQPGDRAGPAPGRQPLDAGAAGAAPGRDSLLAEPAGWHGAEHGRWGAQRDLLRPLFLQRRLLPEGGRQRPQSPLAAETGAQQRPAAAPGHQPADPQSDHGGTGTHPRDHAWPQHPGAPGAGGGLGAGAPQLRRPPAQPHLPEQWHPPAAAAGQVPLRKPPAGHATCTTSAANGVWSIRQRHHQPHSQRLRWQQGQGQQTIPAPAPFRQLQPE